MDGKIVTPIRSVHDPDNARCPHCGAGDCFQEVIRCRTTGGLVSVPDGSQPVQLLGAGAARTLEDLLHYIEDRCDRAVSVVKVVARSVEADEFGFEKDADAGRLLGAALERIAEELDELSTLALHARVPKAVA